MIAAWMLGSTLFALLLCVAAYAGEHALRLTRRATRTPWFVAIALAVVWPLMAPVVLKPAAAASSNVTASMPPGGWSPATIIAAQLPANAVTWEQRTATLLLVVWAVVSAAMLIRLLVATRVLSRLTRNAQQLHLDGEPVLVTESLGPAVVGFWTPRVAVPEWLLQLDEPLRELVLRHEREHCRSRDPQLVWMASLAVALMPWNVGIWIMSRRLRLALEIDCDARTLGRETDARKYSRLLLLIAQRQSSYPLASMLAESTSHLSQRITAMQLTPLKKPMVRVALFIAAASAAVVAACSPRIASDLTGPGTKPVSAIAVKAEAEKMSPGNVYFESQVEQPVKAAQGSKGPIYPAELKAAGVGGTVLAMFVVNEQGLAEPATLKILKTDDPQFEAAIRDALPGMTFEPARIGGRTVKQLVQQPFRFAVNKATAGAVVPAGTSPRAASASQTLAERRALAARSAIGAPAETRSVTATADLASDKFLPGSKGPAYPEMLKASGVEGSVVVQFVINADGTPDMSSLKVLKSDHNLFTQAVKDALPGMRFAPPMLDGRAVRKLTQQPFQFSLSR